MVKSSRLRTTALPRFNLICLATGTVKQSFIYCYFSTITNFSLQKKNPMFTSCFSKHARISSFIFRHIMTSLNIHTQPTFFSKWSDHLKNYPTSFISLCDFQNVPFSTKKKQTVLNGILPPILFYFSLKYIPLNL